MNLPLHCTYFETWVEILRQRQNTRELLHVRMDRAVSWLREQLSRFWLPWNRPQKTKKKKKVRTELLLLVLGWEIRLKSSCTCRETTTLKQRLWLSCCIACTATFDENLLGFTWRHSWTHCLLTVADYYNVLTLVPIIFCFHMCYEWDYGHIFDPLI